MPRGVRKPIVPQVPGAKPAEDAQPAAEAVSTATAVPAPGELPDQDDIVPWTIKRPVLTKQGWVVPVDRPGPQFAKG